MTPRSPPAPTRFARCVLPCLLGAFMFAVYALTLDRWVSPESLHPIARLCGLVWLPQVSSAVYYLVTSPLRWLPLAWIPLAANCSAAVCAALSLILLARSVALLPHDRTPLERERNSNPAALPAQVIWLPPILAVLACGLQLTFWEHAVAATGEMFDLLLFACMVWCLVEYPNQRREHWLFGLALASGLGVANNWAMLAFLPAILAALFWIVAVPRCFQRKHIEAFLERVLRQKLRAFKPGLVLRLAACWMTGASLFFLLPILAAHSADGHGGFWSSVRYILHTYRGMLTSVPWYLLLALCLASVLPVFFIGIRWGFIFGEFKPMAVFLGNCVMHLMHASLLAACLWIVLDSPLSPRRLVPGLPCLPLYYLAALSIGYFSGYFLIILGAKADGTGRKLRRPALVMNRTGTTIAGVSLSIAFGLLIDKNLPAIRARGSGWLAGYFEAVQQTLPPTGGAVLSEDSTRLNYLQMSLIRHGKQAAYLCVDTRLLEESPGYARWLINSNPDFGLKRLTGGLTEPAVLIQNLAGNHAIYCLHPVVGYLGEVFDFEPSGLLYQFKLHPTEATASASMALDSLAKNQTFWQTVDRQSLTPLLRYALREGSANNRAIGEQLMRTLHLTHDRDGAAIAAASYYAAALNSWGVELERNGMIDQASRCFSEARLLNPDNTATRINDQFNRDLQARKPVVLSVGSELEEKLGARAYWSQVIEQDGLIDDPNVCYRLGKILGDARLYRQSIQLFERVRSLAPADTNAPLRLAELYYIGEDYPNALAAARNVLQLAPANTRALYLQGDSQAHLQLHHAAIASLSQLMAMPGAPAEAHLARGYAYRQIGNLPAAQEDYEQAALALPGSYRAYYGLAEIAYKERNLPAALTNCRRYLANAPPDLPETQEVKAWMKEASANDQRNQ